MDREGIFSQLSAVIYDILKDKIYFNPLLLKNRSMAFNGKRVSRK